MKTKYKTFSINAIITTPERLTEDEIGSRLRIMWATSMGMNFVMKGKLTGLPEVKVKGKKRKP